MNKVDIIGIGFCAVDYVGIVPHTPIDSKVEIKNLVRQGGGPAATAVVAAAKLGASAGFIGKVGSDEGGRFILNDFKKNGVDTEGMVIEKSASSASAFVWVEKKTGKRSIAWNRGTKSLLKVEEINKDYIKHVKIIHLDGHEAKAAMEVIGLIKQYGGKISLDGGTITSNIEKIVKITDILIVSEEFAIKFTGHDDTSGYLKKLQEYNPEVLIVTKGKNGFCGYLDGKYIEKNAFKVNVVDTTGAGDVFHGAFLYAYVKKMEIEEALTFASAVSALKCTKYGVRSAIPTFKGTMKFINENRDKI